MAIQERKLKVQEDLLSQLSKSEEAAVHEQSQLDQLFREDVLYSEIVLDLQRMKKANLRLENLQNDNKVDMLKAEIVEIDNKFHDIESEESRDELELKELKDEIAKLQSENDHLLQKAESVDLETVKLELYNLQKISSQLHETVLKDRACQMKLEQAMLHKHLYRMRDIFSKSRDDEIENEDYEGPSIEMAESEFQYQLHELNEIYSDYEFIYSRFSNQKLKTGPQLSSNYNSEWGENNYKEILKTTRAKDESNP